MSTPEVERVIIYVDELPDCECCEQPWCPLHMDHYADYPCIGPGNDDDEKQPTTECDKTPSQQYNFPSLP